MPVCPNKKMNRWLCRQARIKEGGGRGRKRERREERRAERRREGGRGVKSKMDFFIIFILCYFILSLFLIIFYLFLFYLFQFLPKTFYVENSGRLQRANNVHIKHGAFPLHPRSQEKHSNG
jgi:hypothetical protein